MMGRPSKLTEQQWREIEKRHLDGEKIRPLAREFGVAESAIRARVSAQTKQIKSVAGQMLNAERALKALPVSAQINALNLADQLRSVSAHLASAANYGAMTAHRMAGIANAKAAAIDEETLLMGEAGTDMLKQISALTKIGNDASFIPLGLLQANKKVIERINDHDDDPLLPVSVTVERRDARITQ